ncbi:MAG: MoxR family ATPase [Bacteroidetes bacterium]|nr:MoxR family ATPase [Bacteroidota bacterium]
MSDKNLILDLSSKYKSLKSEIAKVIIGHDEVVNHICISILSRGHSLLVGVPGLAKTLLVKTISQALDLSFNRIQFTPDLMPSDITGTEILEQNLNTGEKVFRFIKGPVFANVLLADEINRTPPKTQAALLEAMQENKVTTGGVTHSLPDPFFVLATQNPIEQEGTYPLPEAQLDRFMFMLWLNYPTHKQEVEIVKSTTTDYLPKVEIVMNAKDIQGFQSLIRRVPVADALIEYVANLVGATRPKSVNSPDYINKWISYGAGPRASQFIILGAKAFALLNGKATPDISDIHTVIPSVLRHRLILNFTAEAEGISTMNIIESLLKTFPK